MTEAVISVYDEKDNLLFANPAFRKLFGLGETELISWVELMRRGQIANHGTRAHSEDFEKWLTGARARRGKVPYKSYTTDMKNGRVLRMTEAVTPEGWMISIAIDIEPAKNGELTLEMDRDIARREAVTDELTNCYNRRGVLGVLAGMISSVPYAEHDFSLASLDIDNFKNINDRFGHNVGDEVLKNFIHHIQNSTRAVDVVGRIGGEEFLIILPSLSVDSACGVIDRIRETLKEVQVGDFSVRYSFSAGLTSSAGLKSVDRALAVVDEALYEAKRGGRQRSVISRSTPVD